VLVKSVFTEAERDLSRASGHYCPSSLAQDLAKLKHRPRIYITHRKRDVEHFTVEELRRMLLELGLRPLLGGEVCEL
jgi:hypothetical protein